MIGFEALPEIPMDKGHTLDQQTGRFRTVKEGAPELVKNSKDQYSRLGVRDKNLRQIVVLISPDGRHLGVLDFAGAKESDFEGWKTWSSRTAGRTSLGEDIEAGHGNGGKSFMVQGAKREAYMCSSTAHLLTKMGFKNDEPSLRYRPGWFKREDGKILRCVPDTDPSTTLANELAPFGLAFSDLPAPARTAFEARKSFTIVHLDGVTEWVDASPRGREELIFLVPERLRTHPQSSLTVESCTVWVLRGKSLLTHSPLGYTLPEPYPSLEKPISHVVPTSLKDPDSGQMIPIPRAGESNPMLVLNTSANHLRTTDKYKALNVIRIRDARNVAATWSVADLAPVASSAYILGTLRYAELPADSLVGNERQQLADTPLVRALRAWTSERVRDLAAQIQRLQASRDSPKDRSATNDALGRLRDLMRKYLSAELESGPTAGGVGGSGGGRDGHKRKPFGEPVTKIVLEPDNVVLTLALGATIPLRCSFQAGSEGKQVPAHSVEVTPIAQGVPVLSLLPGLEIKGVQVGTTRLKLRTAEGGVESNEIEVRVVELQTLRIDPPTELLKQGEKRKLNVVATLSDGTLLTDMVHEVSVDEPEMGRLGRRAVFTAGGHAGSATVRIRYGPVESQFAASSILIGEEKVVHERGSRGADIPHIILCGHEAPGFEERPSDQRTLMPGPQMPTIIDYDPLWQDDDGRNKVIWINPESAEALKVRGSRGSSGAMGLRTITFRQFLAQKCFEVLQRLKVAIEVGDDAQTSVEFFSRLAQAELDTVSFLDAAYELVDQLEGE
jgi:hypothetical protein